MRLDLITRDCFSSEQGVVSLPSLIASGVCGFTMWRTEGGSSLGASFGNLSSVGTMYDSILFYRSWTSTDLVTWNWRGCFVSSGYLKLKWVVVVSYNTYILILHINLTTVCESQLAICIWISGSERGARSHRFQINPKNCPIFILQPECLENFQRQWQSIYDTSHK